MSDKGGNKKEDAKLLPTVEQQTSQEDASGNDDQNPFYSSSAELLDADSSSKLETKGPEGREVKKSRADIPPSSGHFSGVFSNTKHGVSQVVGKLLGGESLRNLNQVNRGAQRVYGEAAYKALIKEEIGPNLQQLIQPGEDARAAYFRHRNIIRDLPFVNTGPELASRIDNYPHYYFNRIVTDANFRHLFRDNVSVLSTAVRGPLARYTNQIVGRILASDVLFSVIFSRVSDLVNFQREFPSPEFVGQVVEKVLADDKHFLRIISSIYTLGVFQRRFPDHTTRALEKVLTENEHFVRIISSIQALAHFQLMFPDHTTRALEKALTEDKCFARIISSIQALEAFQEAFQEAFPASVERAGKKVLEDKHFVRIISSIHDLGHFRRMFPEDATRAGEKVLAEDKYFVRIIFLIHDLEYFQRMFPECATRALEKVLTEDKHFVRIISSIHDLKRFRWMFPEYAARAGEKVLAEDKHFVRIISSIHDLKVFQGVFPEYASRAEKIFKAKQQAEQEDAKSVGPSTSGHSNKSAFSSVGGPSMFASGSSITTNSPQGQPPVLEAKEEASERSEGSNFSASTPAADLPAGNNGGASRQESSGASSGDLPSGDNDKNEGTDRNPPPSPRGG